MATLALISDVRRRWPARAREAYTERLAHVGRPYLASVYGDAVPAPSGPVSMVPWSGPVDGRTFTEHRSARRTAADGQWRRKVEAPAARLSARRKLAAPLLAELAACPWPSRADYPDLSNAELDRAQRLWWHGLALRIAEARPEDDRALRALCRRDLEWQEEVSDAIALLWQRAAAWLALPWRSRLKVPLESYRVPGEHQRRPGAAVTDPVRYVRGVARKLAHGHDGRSAVDARNPRMRLEDAIGEAIAPPMVHDSTAVGEGLDVLASMLPPGRRREVWIRAARKRLAPTAPDTAPRRRGRPRGVALTRQERRAMEAFRRALAHRSRRDISRISGQEMP